MEGIVTLARGLGMTTVAKGVETPEQIVRLVELGCDCSQGPPVDGPDALARIVAGLPARAVVSE